MPIQIREIVEKFPDLLALKRQSAERTTVNRLQDPLLANEDDLIFVSTPKHLSDALKSKARSWVVQENLVDQVPGQVLNLFTSRNVTLAMAKIGQQFFPLRQHYIPVEGPPVAKSAVISNSAKLGAGCIVGPGAVIGDGCILGDGVIIGANSVLEPMVQVGAHTHIHPLVFIGHSCQIGSRCIIKPSTTVGGDGFGYAQDAQFNHHRIIHYGRVVIEDDVHIGSNVTIDRGTFQDSRIGAGSRIDNYSHFGHNIQMGKNNLVTGGMITAGSVTLGSHSVFGGRTTIAGHIQIADKVQIGGLSGVTKSITEAGEYGGFPLQDLKSEMRTRAGLKQLPAMIKSVRKILKHLGLDDGSLDKQDT